MLTREENEFLCRTGPVTPMGTFFRRFWIPALLSSELPAPDCPPVRVRLLSEDLVAFRDTEGTVGMLDAHCPHRRADLFFGRNEQSGLRCVYHGWKFDVSGACVDMPNEPAESNFKGKITTTAYPCREQGGIIWTYMGPEQLTPDMPDLDWALAPESHRFLGKALVDCNYFQAMEGELDNSHVSFLHNMAAPGVFQPRRGFSPLAGYQMRDRTPRGHVQETEYGLMHAWRRNADEQRYHWRVNHFLMPCYTLVASPPGFTSLALARPPRDDESSWAFVVQWNAGRPLTQAERANYEAGLGFLPALIPGTFRPKANIDTDFLIDRQLQRSFSFTGIPGSAYNQDLAVTVTQGAIIDRTKEHLGAADVVAIAARRRMINLARALQEGVEPSAAHHGEAYRVRPVEGLLGHDVPFDEGTKGWVSGERAWVPEPSFV